MRVMVTGGTGFVGSHTVRAFLQAGHDVRLLVRDADKVRRVFDPFDIAIAERDVVVGDVVDEENVAAAMHGCDAVFHGAAVVDMRRSQAQQVLETNARGVEHVVGGAARRGLPSIVYVSSMSIFFQPGTGVLDIDMPIAQATTAYGQSKANAERTIRRLQAEGAPIRTTYPTGIVGPDDPAMSEANQAIYTFFADIGVITSGCYQAVDVRDLAALHLRQLELPAGPHRHPAGGPALPWPELYELFDELVGHRVRRVPIPGPAMRALGRIGEAVKRIYDFNFPLTRDGMEYATRWPGADCSKTTEQLGLTFRPPSETYRDTLRWMHAAGHLPAHSIGHLAGG